MDRSAGALTARTELSGVLETSDGFEGFFRAESATLFRRLWLITGNRAEAEDIEQEAFLRLWERLDRMGEVRDPTAYLYRTAMNVFRRRHRRRLLELRRVFALAPAEDDFARAETRQIVRRVLAKLSPRQRAALVLIELLGFTSEEAGRTLGVRASTVRALAHQGRAAFATLMGGDDA
jgi:RNA polymerase sigma-70 factor (ECF subfamily)